MKRDIFLYSFEAFNLKSDINTFYWLEAEETKLIESKESGSERNSSDSCAWFAELESFIRAFDGAATRESGTEGLIPLCKDTSVDSVLVLIYMKQAMPFAVYCLLGSYLVLNTVNVYSLPIDDGAVSCFSFHLDCSLLLWLKMWMSFGMNQIIQWKKGGELRDWINWTTISDFLFFQPMPLQRSRRLRIIHFWCFGFFLLSFYFTNHRREGRNTLEIFLVDEGLQT